MQARSTRISRRVPDEVLARNSERFGTPMGMDTINGWNDHQDDGASPGASMIEPATHRARLRRTVE